MVSSLLDIYYQALVIMVKGHPDLRLFVTQAFCDRCIQCLHPSTVISFKLRSNSKAGQDCLYKVADWKKTALTKFQAGQDCLDKVAGWIRQHGKSRRLDKSAWAKLQDGQY
ncbi:hypothetical protein MAR_024975 [Mya arenaria]|uniref:Uncharacterized protein n=1 Tax=Mya arenaria TaxID=6604 RepID=A0ABY7DSC6_MYAAR|nr:hypothetical protein MAR_024975 [Mya arenaria]